MIFSRETLDSNSKLNSLVQAESTQLLQQDSDVQAGSLEVSKHFQGFHLGCHPFFISIWSYHRVLFGFQKSGESQESQTHFKQHPRIE